MASVTSGSSGPTPTSISSNPASIAPSSANTRTTDSSPTASTKISLSRTFLGGLVAAIISAIIIALLLLLLLYQQRKGVSLFKCFRPNRRNDAPALATTDAVADTVGFLTDRTSFDPLPPYTPANDTPIPAVHIVPSPAPKGRPVQMIVEQRRIEELHTETGQYSNGHVESGRWQQEGSSVITYRSSESALRVDNAPDPRIMKQIIALRAQIHHWEEQLTSGMPSQ